MAKDVLNWFNDHRDQIDKGRKAYFARVKYMKQARMSGGGIRRKLHRVKANVPDDRWGDFMKFMHIDSPFKGHYTTLCNHSKENLYLFVEEEDAALFKLYWG